MLSPVEVEMWVAGVVGLAATVEDIARRTISNWLPLAALAGGISSQMLAHGWKGLLTALGGAVCGFAVFLVFYVLGGMGGGDVKLMAGFGAVVGLSRLFPFAFWTAVVGGIMALGALGFAAARARLGPKTDEKRKPVAIPYAPAIVAGVWLTLLSSQ